VNTTSSGSAARSSLALVARFIGTLQGVGSSDRPSGTPAPGERIQLTEAQFGRLANAFLDEIDDKFVPSA
jgi:hypothetical protein